MKNLFENLGIEISELQLNKFRKYYELLIEYNNKFNITAITEEKEVYIKNFIDSIIFNENFKSGNLIDIGSGGGFPAVPLKIMNDNLNVTMVEATGKKCEFLNVLIKEMQLNNIKVLNARAEDLAKKVEFRENFDYCTSRAVSRLNTLCEYCLPFVKVGGYMQAFKGIVDEEVLEAKTSVKILGGDIKSVVKKEIFSLSRSLVVIEKINKTDDIYPRQNSKIKKYPL